tara:strand:+ start:26590 stop:27702 length:1113 start_codon:yes stop_codon:yes gene_type:complete
MKKHILYFFIFVVVVILTILAIIRYQNLKKNKMIFSNRSRAALQNGNTASILIGIKNSKSNGYLVAEFIKNSLYLATSPLRLHFIVVNDNTSQVGVKKHLNYMLQDHSIFTDISTININSCSFFDFIIAVQSSYQNEKAILLVNCDCINFVKGFDEMIIDLIFKKHQYTNKQNNDTQMVFSSAHPNLFSTLRILNHNNKWPSTYYKRSIHNIATPNLCCATQMLLFDGVTFSRLQKHPNFKFKCDSIPANLLNLLVTSYFLNQFVVPYTIPLHFFNGHNLNKPNHRDDKERLIEFAHQEKEEQEDPLTCIINLIGKDSRKYMGLDEILVPNNLAMSGLTPHAMNSNEAVVKYGSNTQARGYINQVKKTLV